MKSERSPKRLTRKSAIEEGWIAPLVLGVVDNIKKISLISLLGEKNNSWVVIEQCVFIAFILEVGILIVLNTDLPAKWIFLIPAIYRFFDIMAAWTYTHLNPKSRGRGPRPYRSLLLALLNFLELILLFAIVDFVFRASFNPPISNVLGSLTYSMQVITTMGSSIIEPIGLLGFILFSMEILSGLIFLVVIISRILTLYEKPSDSN